MAANNPRQLRDFLRQLTTLGHLPSATAITNARHDGDPLVVHVSELINFRVPFAPGPPPRWLTPVAITPAQWTAFYGNLSRPVHNRRHPLRNDEALVVSFFDLFMDPVLTALNTSVASARARYFQRGGHESLDIGGVGQRIHVTGTCGYTIWCTDTDLCCLVEHKRYARGVNLFERGRDQALVYAALLAHGRTQRHRHALAIVTDLHRWQFLRVEATGFQESPVLEVNFDRGTGMPDEDQLRQVLQLAVGFLHAGWP